MHNHCQLCLSRSGYLTLAGHKPRIQKLSITAGSNQHPTEASWSKLSPSSPCLFQTIVSMNPLSSRWQQIGSMFWNYFWLLQPTHVQYMYPSFHTLFVLHALVASKRLGAFYESSRHGLQTVHPSVIHMWITRCVQWPKDSRFGAPLSLPSVWSSYKARNQGRRMSSQEAQWTNAENIDHQTRLNCLSLFAYTDA